MNEHDFDDLLKGAVPDLPPDDIVREVTPWRRAMDRILPGMALCAITLNFFLLNYLLPTIGVILLLLGFRTLRGENGWFRAGWILALAQVACCLLTLILNAAVERNAVFASPLGQVLPLGNGVLHFLLILCLWRGITAVQRKAGIPVHTGSAAALLVWYAALLLLAFVQYDGLLLGTVMIVCYILIIRSLCRLSKETEESGYAVKAAEVRLSDRKLVGAIISVLVLGIVCGYLFFGSYRMSWQAETSEESAELSEIKEELLALGYPGAALNDLSGEDLLACNGALRVVAQECDQPVNSGREVWTVQGNITHITTVYDVKELHLTDVAVELPGETPQWKVFHHFLWTLDPGFCGTEALQLWPAYRDSEGWTSAGDLTGCVLYDKNGTVYTAPFHSLAAEGYTADSIFWGERYVRDVFATFSMPENGERQRGYVSYGIEELQAGWIVDSWVNYVHQRHRLQYPVLTAEESRKTSGWNDTGPFITVQNALQFFITETGIDLN